MPQAVKGFGKTPTSPWCHWCAMLEKSGDTRREFRGNEVLFVTFGVCQGGDCVVDAEDAVLAQIH